MLHTQAHTHATVIRHNVVRVSVKTGASSQRNSRKVGSYFQGFPGGSAGKESTCNMGHLDSIPGLRGSPGEGKGYPLQYSGLENSIDSLWGHKESDTTEQLSLHFISGTDLNLREIGRIKVHFHGQISKKIKRKASSKNMFS